MRIVFMGTPAFAAETLIFLALSEHDVVAAYTRPDAVRKRGSVPEPSAVASAATLFDIAIETPRSFYAKAADGLPVLDAQGQRAVDAVLLEQLRTYEPDIIVVSAYGLILPQAVLDVPRFGCLNIHFSLLPRWRGAAPVQRAILAGDAQVGTSIMQVTAELDAGAYCSQRELPTGDHSAEELSDALAKLGQEALLYALDAIECGGVQWVEQDESLVTYAHKLSKVELMLSPELDALTNVRRVRASSHSAPARCNLAGRNVAITKVTLAGELKPLASGEVSVAGGKRLLLGTSDGSFEVLNLRPEGRNEMDAAAFIAGNQELHARSSNWLAL